MRTIFIVAAVSVATLLCDRAGARDLAPSTIDGLASECRPIKDWEESKPLNDRQSSGLMLCLGYFAGAFEAIHSMKSEVFCVPDGVQIGQRVKIFVKWADENPDALHMPRYYGLQVSMMKAFPCA